MGRETIIIASSLAYSLTNFRGPLIARLLEEGYRVIATAPDIDVAVIAELAALDVEFRRVPMDRTGLNPLHDLGTCLSYLRLFRAERPSLVIAYTQKPIIYAGLALRAVPGPRFVPMITGLGYVFSDPGRSRWLQTLTVRLFRAALKRAGRVLVFNGDDARELQLRGMVADARALSQVPGSGVDLTRFGHRPVPDGPPVFLLIARLLSDKGLREFAAAAAIVRARFPSARFRLLGPFDSNPAEIPREEIDGWVRSGCIDYLGAAHDVAPHLAACSVYVLPSYREGLPRTVLEAMAVGRAIITTDAPGCRDTVEPGGNGFRVAPRSAEELAEAMLRFCDDPALAHRMGARSRALVEARYDAAQVSRRTLDAILPERRDASSVRIAAEGASGRRSGDVMPALSSGSPLLE